MDFCLNFRRWLKFGQLHTMTFNCGVVLHLYKGKCSTCLAIPAFYFILRGLSELDKLLNHNIYNDLTQECKFQFKHLDSSVLHFTASANQLDSIIGFLKESTSLSYIILLVSLSLATGVVLGKNPFFPSRLDA